METHKTALFDLFRRERQYCVPLFQRPYVWAQAKQWEPLWADVTDRGRAVLDHGQAGRRGALIRNHFLGAIVTRRLEVFGPHIDAAEVIDGQQRLTTLQILLVAFHDYLRNLPEELGMNLSRVASDLGSLTRNSGVMSAEHEVFKVWPTNADRETFRKVVTAAGPDEVKQRFPLVRRKYQRKPDPRPRLAEAYLFFHGAVAEFCGEDGDGRAAPLEQRVHALYEALRRHVLLVHIELQDDDDPQVIFESLNARGEPLLPSDLIRNFVFMRASAQGLDADGLYEKWWKEYDERESPYNDRGEDRFWKQKDRQGRLRRPRLDLFVYHYLQSMVSEEVSIGHLYQTFRDWWDDSSEPREIETELERMRRHSDVFADLVMPTGDDRVAHFARRLRVLDTSTVYPVVLFLLVGGRQRVAEGELVGILEDLESYLVRRMVCGLTTKSYNKFFLGLLRKLRDAEHIDRQLVQGHLLDGTGPAVVWPDDTMLERSWLSRPVYRDLKSHRVSMVLKAINADLHSNKQESIAFTGELTVEHVLPVGWAAPAWPEPAVPGEPGPDDEHPVDRRNRLLHTFGNLTLLTQALNSSVSNGAYTHKRPRIAEQSLSRMNTWFQTAVAWNEGAILERGAALLGTAKVIWQHPGQQSASR